MKLMLLLSLVAAFTTKARAENPIPAELVGVWKTEATFIFLRGDGLCMMFGTVGTAGVATYDPKTHLLMMTFRHEGKEVGKVTALYDSKALTLTPREKGFEAVYKRHSDHLGGHFESLDLKKILEPSK